MLSIPGRLSKKTTMCVFVSSTGCANFNHFPFITTSANLEVVVLPLLFGFQVESSQTSEVLLTNCLVHRGSAANTLTVVMSCVRPPISFGLHVAEDHVLDRRRKTGNLPRNVSLPAAPRFAQVLQNRPCFVLLDAFRHHVENIMHHLNTQHQPALTSQ